MAPLANQWEPLGNLRGPQGEKGDPGADGGTTLHASRHSTGGSDPLTPAAIGAAEATHTHSDGGAAGVPPLIWTGQRSNHYYPRPFALLGGGGTPTRDALVVVPWLFDAPVDINGVSMYWASASSGRSVRFGIYSETSGMPTDLLWDSGSIPCPSIQEAFAPVSMTLGPGRVWIGMVPHGGGSTKLEDHSPAFAVAPGVSWGPLSGSGFHLHRYTYTHDATVSGALPGTFTPDFASINRMPVMFIRAA